MTEKLLSHKTVFRGHLLVVHSDLVATPDGKESVREWVEHPGAAAVVPLLDGGDTLLVRQFRYATGREFLEVPAGKMDAPGEQPADVAARELEEETGWTAAVLEPLGPLYPCIGYSDEVIHLFLARDLRAGRPTTDDGEVLEVVRLPFAEAVRMARSGKIADAKSVVALVRAWERVGGGSRFVGGGQ